MEIFNSWVFWVILLAIIIVMAIIGYLAEGTVLGRKKKEPEQEEVEPTKIEETTDITQPEKQSVDEAKSAEEPVIPTEVKEEPVVAAPTENEPVAPTAEQLFNQVPESLQEVKKIPVEPVQFNVETMVVPAPETFTVDDSAAKSNTSIPEPANMAETVEPTQEDNQEKKETNVTDEDVWNQ